ncbi:uracil phosphoribosyltransferase [Xanthovirga aplysinae]|uniref:uracil phosphoribosyltransferase n=1 Tax=Xanthovirga aplysinae TaxID=2529853 RepID=UPI0012BC48E5|nr:uracil phosphoribosyltransferase [Xanthovirga aplysinae]MTI32011.1 uracil phosphoribosyltransferase [Xanthovirga aplysinae]
MFILNKENSIANHFLAELRDVNIQRDSLRFRKNLERLGELLAYELSKTLQYDPHSIQTPMCGTSVELLKEQPVLVTILRAGLPFYQGVLNFFDQADSGFIGAFRAPANTERGFEIEMGYKTTPDLEGKQLIVADPMLASGKSLIHALEGILKNGTPAHVHILAAIAAPEGIAYIKENLKVEHSFWLGALDEKLDKKSYIIPGLGDAGDLAFGSKI